MRFILPCVTIATRMKTIYAIQHNTIQNNTRQSLWFRFNTIETEGKAGEEE